MSDLDDLKIGCEYIYEYDPTFDLFDIVDESLAVRSGDIVIIINFPDDNTANVLFRDDIEFTVTIDELHDKAKVEGIGYDI